jgi:hypothetical protein
MTLVPFHLGWRGLQNRRAGFESWKEPPEQHCELPAAWRSVAHNELLTTRRADRTSRFDPDGVVDSHAGHRSLEVFAAALSIEWG